MGPPPRHPDRTGGGCQRALYGRGDFAGALREYRALASIQRDAGLYRTIADLSERSGDYAGQVDALLQVVDWSPATSSPRAIWASRSPHSGHIESRARRAAPDRAALSERPARAREPRDRARGREQARRGHPRVREGHPAGSPFSDARNRFGILLAQTGHSIEAASAFAETLRDPGNVDAQTNLTEVERGLLRRVSTALPTALARPSIWGRPFVNSIVDVLLIGGGLSLFVLALGLRIPDATLTAPRLPFLVFASNSPHFAASTVRLYTKPNALRDMPFATMVLPILTIAAADALRGGREWIAVRAASHRSAPCQAARLPDVRTARR